MRNRPVPQTERSPPFLCGGRKGVSDGEGTFEEREKRPRRSFNTTKNQPKKLPKERESLL